MTKIHGDFGDMARYSVYVDAVRRAIVLVCDDCETELSWFAEGTSMADVNRAAAEHETTEERT